MDTVPDEELALVLDQVKADLFMDSVPHEELALVLDTGKSLLVYGYCTR